MSSPGADGERAGDPDTAVGIAAAVRGGGTTALQVTEAALTRIEGARRFGAFVRVRADAARVEAAAVDRRDDRTRLPLAGVPVAVKDNVPVAGEPMRIGSEGSDPSPQADDHEVVRRLRDAGAVVVGLTAVPELCVFATTDSTAGITRNPREPSRTPGGSSGGSAAAVASGAVPIAHGNDGLGSIRIPAACCGLVGIKPGAGVVPSGLGDGSWFGMAENGPLATTVADAALLLAVLAGRPGLATVGDPGRLRVAVSLRVPTPGVVLDPAWGAAAVESGALLAAAGHRVVRADPPYDLRLGLSQLARWTAGAELDARLLRDRAVLAPRTVRHTAVGRMVLAAGFPRRDGAGGRARWQTRLEHFFGDLDVLVTPALAQPPPPAVAWAARSWAANVVSNLRYAPFAAPWNLAGWPAMSVPAGRHPDGTPLAVQLVGKPGAESQLLAVAAQLENVRGVPSR